MHKTKKRLTVILILLIITFLALFLKDRLSLILAKKTPPLFSDVVKENITEVIFVKENKISNIYKKNNNWYLKKDQTEFLADNERVNKAIEALLNLKKEDLASTNKSKHEQLGLKTDKIAVKAKNKTYNLFIGKTASFTKNYLRLNDESEVFTGTGFDSLFYPEDWRDLKVHFIDDETKVSSVQIEFEKNITILAKKGDKWIVGTASSGATKKDRLDFFLNDLKTLKASDLMVKTSTLEAKLKKELVLKVKENKVEKTAEFSKKDKDLYYLKTLNSIYLFEIPATYVESLKKQEKDFIE